MREYRKASPEQAAAVLLSIKSGKRELDKYAGILWQDPGLLHLVIYALHWEMTNGSKHNAASAEENLRILKHTNSLIRSYSGECFEWDKKQKFSLITGLHHAVIRTDNYPMHDGMLEYGICSEQGANLADLCIGLSNDSEWKQKLENTFNAKTLITPMQLAVLKRDFDRFVRLIRRGYESTLSEWNMMLNDAELDKKYIEALLNRSNKDYIFDLFNNDPKLSWVTLFREGNNSLFIKHCLELGILTKDAKIKFEDKLLTPIELACVVKSGPHVFNVLGTYFDVPDLKTSESDETEIKVFEEKKEMAIQYRSNEKDKSSGASRSKEEPESSLTSKISNFFSLQKK